jgi:D-lyxose ketol-isomerase
MKRSKINAIIKEMEELITKHQFAMPPFATWSATDWKNAGTEYNEIRDNNLGWDITDFGLGNFEHTGFSLFTIRNGTQNSQKYPKPYAEKLLMLREGQYAPLHYHWYKMEDIINRGGNTVYITVYNGTKEGEKETTPVEVQQDGRCYEVPAGTKIALNPGESITIPPYLYHDFYVPTNGKGSVLLGEVSMCNDDANDNRFYEPIGRFPTIEEDEVPYRLLCTEYPTE